ncbi:MAG: hypothetical protein AAFP89_06945 [Bacteroidota bacterium]
MKYLLLYKFSLSEDVLKQECQNQSQSIHVYVKRKFREYLKQEDYRDAGKFNSLVNDLYHLRVQSDYLDVQINQLQAFNATDKAEQINSIIKKHFKV